MQRIPRTAVKIIERQRTGTLESLRDGELRASIETKGLLHPVVLAEEPERGTYRLIAGGRRLAQIDWIAEDEAYFLCNRETILPGEVPATLLSELSPLDLMEAELEENIRRIDLPWQDRVRAIAEIHRLKGQSVKETAVEFADKTGVPLSTAKKQIMNAIPIAAHLNNAEVKAAPNVTEALAAVKRVVTAEQLQAALVARHLDDPIIAQARNSKEAFQLIIQREEAQARVALITRRQQLSSEVRLENGDCIAIMPTLEEGLVDLILTDPPYGISAGGAGFRARTVHHHNYADDADSARRVVSAIITEGFRITKPRANLFIFCDVDFWPWLQEYAAKAGWSPFRTPIVWAKSDSEGLAPWGKQGFRRTYELIFFATKGQRGLISSPVDILRHNRVSRSERDYGAAKPEPLMRELIECSTLPNDFVFDPCCGTGASILAAKNTSRRGLGIELDKNAYTLALAKLAGQEEAEDEEEDSAPSVADL